MIIGNREFDTENRCYIMGILNVTPDSFSDGGKYTDVDAALFHAEQMIKDGADIIDIGAESTHPGYTIIPDDEEIERLLPALTAIRTRFDIPISVDTYKSKVALEAARAGADLINDIWGLKYDERIADVIADYQLACCLMHNRPEPNYVKFMREVKNDLSETLAIAARHGIKKEKIMIDPGVGFGKTFENNLEVIHKVSSLKELGCPILLGTSRKSVIGNALNLPKEEREEGTITTSVYGMLQGCSFFRVHDVKGNVRALKMMKAILDEGI